MQADPSSAAPDESTERRLLVLPSTGADQLALGKLFDATGIPYAACRSIAQLCELHRGGAATLLVPEEALVADSSELVACIAAQPVWSDLPVIVLSRSGRESASLPGIVTQLGN